MFSERKLFFVQLKTLGLTSLLEATHWTGRTMAQTTGLAVQTVQTIWKAHGLTQRRWLAFKLSAYAIFVEKLTVIVSLYVNLPPQALISSMDEKSQIQMLDRTQPDLPIKKGQIGTIIHDRKRRGTTTLLSALNVLTGDVFARNIQRNRHQEFIRFLNALERESPVGKVVHVILDNYATHKKPEVEHWLERNPYWMFRYTPPFGSWLNAAIGVNLLLSIAKLESK